jgi:hypothetical protein
MPYTRALFASFGAGVLFLVAMKLGRIGCRLVGWGARLLAWAEVNGAAGGTT